MKIAISAGEASGDHLGAEVIKAIKAKVPEATFYGIAGKKMVAAGCDAIYPMEALSVMGVSDVLKNLPRLLGIRKSFKTYVLDNKPDVFIGIDAPDFHLSLEKKLKKSGIKTAHYVSPSVWAWRKGRIKTIKKGVDKVFTLFPFEEKFYHKHKVDAMFVGHPMADELVGKDSNQSTVRQNFGYASDAKVVAILPGSRRMEIEQLGMTYLETAKWMHQRQPNLHFIIPATNEKIKALIEQQIIKLDYKLPVKVVLGRVREVVTVSDVVLATSGTVTLETMLLKKPMVVAYKMTALNWFIAKAMIKIDYFSLPNLLAGEKIIPEFLQQTVTIPNLGHALFEWLNNKRATENLMSHYDKLSGQLKQEANQSVADNVLSLIKT